MKLELTHRRQKWTEMTEKAALADEYKAKNTQLERLNDELCRELERRDGALADAIKMIDSYEKHVGELEAALDDAKRATEELKAKWERPKFTRSSYELAAAVTPFKQKMQKTKASSPSPSMNLIDLRTPAPDRRKEIPETPVKKRGHPKPLNIQQNGEGSDNDASPNHSFVLDSPRLSVLSESSFASVYGFKEEARACQEEQDDDSIFGEKLNFGRPDTARRIVEDDEADDDDPLDRPSPREKMQKYITMSLLDEDLPPLPTSTDDPMERFSDDFEDDEESEEVIPMSDFDLYMAETDARINRRFSIMSISPATSDFAIKEKDPDLRPYGSLIMRKDGLWTPIETPTSTKFRKAIRSEKKAHGRHTSCATVRPVKERVTHRKRAQTAQPGLNAAGTENIIKPVQSTTSLSSTESGVKITQFSSTAATSTTTVSEGASVKYTPTAMSRYSIDSQRKAVAPAKAANKYSDTGLKKTSKAEKRRSLSSSRAVTTAKRVFSFGRNSFSLDAKATETFMATTSIAENPAEPAPFVDKKEKRKSLRLAWNSGTKSKNK